MDCLNLRKLAGVIVPPRSLFSGSPRSAGNPLLSRDWSFSLPPLHLRYLPLQACSTYALVIPQVGEDRWTPPQRQERRDFRYPLHLPVLIRIAQRKEMHVRSENISLGGILLSSAFLIPEGAVVEVSVGVEHLPDPGILLNARGKVLRVQPKDTGDFSVAIKLEDAFKLPLSGKESPLSSQKKESLHPKNRKCASVNLTSMSFAPDWHTEA